MLRNDINVVFVTLPMTRDRRCRSVEGLRDSTVSIYFVPDLFAFNLIRGRVTHHGAGWRCANRRFTACAHSPSASPTS